MRTLVLTAFDDRMAPLGELTAPRMMDYATRHGFDFYCDRDFTDGKVSYWRKIPLVIGFLHSHDRVLWLDADQAITNFDLVPPGDFGFNASLDWGVDAYDASFSMCGFMAYRDSLRLFDWVADRESDFIHGSFPEQTPMRALYRDGMEGMHIYGRHAYNAVPIQVHESVVEPWTPECFAAHITMLPVEDRVKIFHEIIK
jgi:galactosyl transferase GMA12/MNN10 family